MQWRGFFLVFALILCTAAGAQDRVEIPGWVLKPIPAIDCNFALGAYYNCPLDKTFSITRASTKYCQWQSQLWMSVASGAPCITDQGWLIEEARTNDALQSRDMTQAVWVSVGMTEALNAVGIDGVANSASTLTATGTAGSCTASCTDLQTITLGSSADTYSVWLKRVTGSGTVNITINNLGAVTPCTLVTTGFTRCTVTATLANPVIGIQMTVVNDVIVADFNQMEPGGFPTSPILTTSVSATRAADLNQITGLLVSSNLSTIAAGTMFFQSFGMYISGVAANLFGTNSGARAVGFNTNTTVQSSWNTGSINLVAGSVVTRSNLTRSILGWSLVGRTIVANGGGIGTDTNVPNSVAGFLGATSAGASNMNGYLQRFVFWPLRIPDGQLQMLTSLN